MPVSYSAFIMIFMIVSSMVVSFTDKMYALIWSDLVTQNNRSSNLSVTNALSGWKLAVIN